MRQHVGFAAVFITLLNAAPRAEACICGPEGLVHALHGVDTQALPANAILWTRSDPVDDNLVVFHLGAGPVAGKWRSFSEARSDGAQKIHAFTPNTMLPRQAAFELRSFVLPLEVLAAEIADPEELRKSGGLVESFATAATPAPLRATPASPPTVTSVVTRSTSGTSTCDRRDGLRRGVTITTEPAFADAAALPAFVVALRDAPGVEALLPTTIFGANVDAASTTGVFNFGTELCALVWPELSADAIAADFRFAVVSATGALGPWSEPLRVEFGALPVSIPRPDDDAEDGLADDDGVADPQGCTAASPAAPLLVLIAMLRRRRGSGRQAHWPNAARQP